MRTIIRGGTLVYGGGVKQEDILIHSGKISEIKPSIRPRGDEKILDAASCFVLPGFISTCPEFDLSDYSHGVTTHIKKISFTLADFQAWTEEGHPFQITEGLNYVYQVGLSEVNKDILDKLDQYRVKVIELEKTLQSVDWEYWQPHLERIGLVVKLEQSAYRRLPPFVNLPLLVPYGSRKRTVRPRTVFQVEAKDQRLWLKWSKKADPYLATSYWLDGQESIILPLGKEQDILYYLMRLVKTRASTPAKLFGIYPQKGSLRVGADADILIVPRDQLGLNEERVLKPSFVAVCGNWIGEADRLKGNYIKANRTYAFAY